MKIKHIIFFYFFLGGYGSYSQTSTNFTIKGTITGLKDGEKLRLYEGKSYFRAEDEIPIAEATVENGSFQMKGYIPLNGGSYGLRTDDYSFGLPLCLDKGSKITIKGVADRSKYGEFVINDVAGAGTQKDRNRFLKTMKPLIAMLNKPGSDRKEITEKIKEAQRKFIRDNKGSYYAPFLFLKKTDDLNLFFGYNARAGYMNNYAMDYKDLKELFDILDEKVKSSYMGIEVGRTINEAETVKQLKSASSDIGETISDVSLQTPFGDTLSIKKLVERKMTKLELLYLWRPRYAFDELGRPNQEFIREVKADIRLLNKLFSKYNDRGFTVISADRDDGMLHLRNGRVEKLENLINEKILWDQLVELRYDNADGGRSYYQESFKVRPLSTYIVLLDGEGKILAKGLTREQAEAKVKEIMGE